MLDLGILVLLEYVMIMCSQPNFIENPDCDRLCKIIYNPLHIVNCEIKVLYKTENHFSELNSPPMRQRFLNVRAAHLRAKKNSEICLAEVRNAVTLNGRQLIFAKPL